MDLRSVLESSYHSHEDLIYEVTMVDQIEYLEYGYHSSGDIEVTESLNVRCMGASSIFLKLTVPYHFSKR